VASSCLTSLLQSGSNRSRFSPWSEPDYAIFYHGGFQIASEVDANVQKPQVDIVRPWNDELHVQILGDSLQITQKRQLAAFVTGVCQTERSCPHPMLNAKRLVPVVSPDEFDHPVGIASVIWDEGQPDLVEITEWPPEPLAPEKDTSPALVFPSIQVNGEPLRLEEGYEGKSDQATADQSDSDNQQ